jgi:hypothetical protein
LFEGRIFDQQQRTKEALAAYRAALSAAPGQTAELAAAAVLLRSGDPGSASSTVDAAVHANEPIDPWLVYGRGDARFWPQIAEQLWMELHK